MFDRHKEPTNYNAVVCMYAYFYARETEYKLIVHKKKVLCCSQFLFVPFSLGHWHKLEQE